MKITKRLAKYIVWATIVALILHVSLGKFHIFSEETTYKLQVGLMVIYVASVLLFAGLIWYVTNKLENVIRGSI